ncbi:hypothetical protein Tco_0343820 [Tanacetum coccineum]
MAGSVGGIGSTFVGETLRKSDQLHQNFKKNTIVMTRKLDDMIELPMSQPKRTYIEDLECEIVMVKMPKCMAWFDDEPIGDKRGTDPPINPYSPGSFRMKEFLKKRKKFFFTDPGDGVRINPDGVARLYLMRRSLEVLRKFHWMILGGRFNQLSHVSSPLLSKPGEY